MKPWFLIWKLVADDVPNTYFFNKTNDTATFSIAKMKELAPQS